MLGVADFRLDFSQPNVNEQIENLKSKIANFPRPLVVDPFAGGGAIPLEALRIGADAFASDLNPIAVLLNKVVLEYIPKYGQRLADEVRKWGEWIKEQAEKELGEFYPKDPDGATPIAYLWARTITCEGPGCGAQVPLMRGLWLAKKGERSVALQIVPDKKHKRIEFEIIAKRNGKWVRTENPRSQISNPSFEGTVKRGSATCPVCGYTTPVASVRKQLKARKGGAADARLFAVVTTKATEQGRFYRLPTERDLNAVKKAAAELKRRERAHRGALSLVPDETLPVMSGVFNAPIYGHNTWGSLFTSRQALALTTIGKFVRDGGEKLAAELDSSLAIAVQTCLAMALDKQADSNSSLCSWRSASEDIGHTFGRQALPMLWDFVEGNVLGGATRDWLNAVEGGLKLLEVLTEIFSKDISNEQVPLHIHCLMTLHNVSSVIHLTTTQFHMLTYLTFFTSGCDAPLVVSILTYFGNPFRLKNKKYVRWLAGIRFVIPTKTKTFLRKKWARQWQKVAACLHRTESVSSSSRINPLVAGKRNSKQWWTPVGQ